MVCSEGGDRGYGWIVGGLGDGYVMVKRKGVEGLWVVIVFLLPWLEGMRLVIGLQLIYQFCSDGIREINSKI